MSRIVERCLDALAKRYYFFVLNSREKRKDSLGVVHSIERYLRVEALSTFSLVSFPLELGVLLLEMGSVQQDYLGDVVGSSRTVYFAFEPFPS
jgi:hypothetical protein